MKNTWILYFHQVTSRVIFGTLLLAMLLLSPRAQAKYDWLQFGFLPDKTANNTLESAITLNNVSGLQSLFSVPLSHNPDGAPVLLTNVSTPSGVKDLIFLFAEQGYTTAFDANTGAEVWTKDFSTGSASSNGPSGFCSGHSSNTAPAIDPNHLYVYTFGMDGNVHKLNVGDGSEVTGGGWPERIMNDAGKARGPFTIATAANGHTYLYGNAGFNKGSMTSIDLGTGAQHVFNTSNAQSPDTHSPSGSYSHASPWSRGPAYNSALNRVFFPTGTYSNFVAGHDWVESLLAIAPDGHTDLVNGGGYPLDSYTPSNWQGYINNDEDLGSANIIQLPTGLSSKYPHLAVMGSSDSQLRIFNLADLSGQGAPGHTGGELKQMGVPIGGPIRSQGTTWTDPATGIVWVFIAGDHGICGLQVAIDGSGNPSLQSKWTLGNGWTTSAIMANGVLFAAVGGGEHTDTTSTHHLQAINPTTGKVVWSASLGQFHWASPIVANGIVYMCDGNSGGFGSGTGGNLHAWNLGGGNVTVADGTYKVINLNSGLAVDAKAQGIVNGTPIQQYTYNGGANQQWTVTSLGGGQYKIIGVQSGLSLEVAGAGTANGTGIDLSDYTGATNQQWSFTATSGGYYRLTPANATGSSLDVKGSSTAPSTLLELWTYNGGSSQQWALQAP